MTMELDSGEVLIPAADIAIPAFYAVPNTAGPHPVIVIIHEIYGIYGHLDTVARELAEEGYLVVAPMFFWRQGDVHKTADHDVVKDMSMRATDRQVHDDLDAVFAWLAGNAQADMNRVGITGFCWGGRHVWLYAAQNPKIRAGVAWYGGPITAEPTEARPRNPLDVARQLKAPVLGLYGGSDHLISLESIHRMQDVLAEEGGVSEIHVYPASQHGFHAPNRSKYDPAASRDGDARLLEWFRLHGVG